MASFTGGGGSGGGVLSEESHGGEAAEPLPKRAKRAMGKAAVTPEDAPAQAEGEGEAEATAASASASPFWVWRASWPCRACSLRTFISR